MSLPMGPFELGDTLGILAAIAVLDRSQDTSGKHETYVQPNTYRKVQTSMGNLARAGCGGMREQVGAGDRQRVWISSVATHTFWFSRFMSGLKRRTGEVIKQDNAISIKELKAILKILEGGWNSARDPDTRLRTARMGLWYAGGFCTALRARRRDAYCGARWYSQQPRQPEGRR